MPLSLTISASSLWVRTISFRRLCSSEDGISRIGSSGDTKSALGGLLPKVFILAEAISCIRYSPARCPQHRGLGPPVLKPNFSFLLDLHDAAINIKHCAN